jgi:uncharacterized protein (TIGR02145 family)
MKSIPALFVLLTLYATKNQAQTVTDYDGNTYHTITIGSQVWMLENLNVTHYNNGDSIPEVIDSLSWVSQHNGAWCNFNNSPANGAVYGKLYNWYAGTDPRGLAPPGWHVPSDEEWKTLELYLGMSPSQADSTDWRGTDQGAQLKETDTLHWHWPTGNTATNSSGFTALGGGWRIYFLHTGSFYNLTNTGEWWTSTEKDSAGAWLRNLCVYHPEVYRISFGKTQGCSVRCIKDIQTGTMKIENGMEINLYPNPAHDFICADGGDWLNLNIHIYTIDGKCVLSKNLNTNARQLDISSLPKGFYCIEMISQNEILVKKLIKE